MLIFHVSMHVDGTRGDSHLAMWNHVFPAHQRSRQEVAKEATEGRYTQVNSHSDMLCPGAPSCLAKTSGPLWPCPSHGSMLMPTLMKHSDFWLLRAFPMLTKVWATEEMTRLFVHRPWSVFLVLSIHISLTSTFVPAFRTSSPFSSGLLVHHQVILLPGPRSIPTGSRSRKGLSSQLPQLINSTHLVDFSLPQHRKHNLWLPFFQHYFY